MRSYGIKTDGTLWAWGRNLEGQLGDGTFENRNVPTQIGIDNNWDRIYAGGNTTTVGVKTDGSVWVWGSNDFGQFGNGTLNQGSNVPLQNNALCTLGVTDFDDKKGSVSFYPNPVTSEATLKWDLNYPIDQYQLFDLQGQLLFENNLAPKITETTMSLEHLPHGIYLLKLWSNNEFITYFKVIKN